eukprot:scaffold384943_cov51-Prasinocladus_malaysianus.AAC.1
MTVLQDEQQAGPSGMTTCSGKLVKHTTAAVLLSPRKLPFFLSVRMSFSCAENKMRLTVISLHDMPHERSVDSSESVGGLRRQVAHDLSAVKGLPVTADNVCLRVKLNRSEPGCELQDTGDDGFPRALHSYGLKDGSSVFLMLVKVGVVDTFVDVFSKEITFVEYP